MDQLMQDIFANAQDKVRQLLEELEKLGAVRMQQERSRQSLDAAAKGLSDAAAIFNELLTQLSTAASAIAKMEPAKLSERMDAIERKTGESTERIAQLIESSLDRRIGLLHKELSVTTDLLTAGIQTVTSTLTHRADKLESGTATVQQRVLHLANQLKVLVPGFVGLGILTVVATLVMLVLR